MSRIIRKMCHKVRSGQKLPHASPNFTNYFFQSNFRYNLSHFSKTVFSKYFFLFSTLNSRMSKKMCIWRHKLCNSKTGVGPTFTWSNEPWYMCVPIFQFRQLFPTLQHRHAGINNPMPHCTALTCTAPYTFFTFQFNIEYIELRCVQHHLVLKWKELCCNLRHCFQNICHNSDTRKHCALKGISSFCTVVHFTALNVIYYFDFHCTVLDSRSTLHKY